MRYKWLNKDNNRELIIFFNGWGMDESIVKHLNPECYDLLMFFDYNNLNLDLELQELNIYKKKFLVAWSMGVMVATKFDIKYDKKTAINGTLLPINNRFGIPERIYNLTLNKFSPLGAKKFISSMFKEECILPNINREFENLKTELEALSHYQANQDFKYDRIILSSDDKIIPTKNQIAFWAIKPNIDSGHAPFYHFKLWSELL